MPENSVFQTYRVTPGIRTEEWEALSISPSKAEEVKERVNDGVEKVIQFASSFA